VPPCIPQRNYLRRTFGAALCLSPVALLAASAAASPLLQRLSPLGISLMVFGLLVGGVNLYLGAFRRPLYRWRHGTMQGCRNVSGFPCVGTVAVVLGGVVGFGDWRTAALGLVILAVDLAGLPWFLVATWRDTSFWDS
jgi:hypothetical protein